MKATLIKENDFYYLIQDDKIVADLDGHPLKSITGKLSKQNCDEIFGVVNVEKLELDYIENQLKGLDKEDYEKYFCFAEADAKEFMKGFNKAMELNKYKVFTESDVFSVVNHVLSELVKFEGFDQKYLFPEEIYQEVTWKAKQIQQPTEIEVEIEMETCSMNPLDLDCDEIIGRKKLDSEGCLILKRVV